MYLEACKMGDVNPSIEFFQLSGLVYNPLKNHIDHIVNKDEIFEQDRYYLKIK